jgi:hypothetical protein
MLFTMRCMYRDGTILSPEESRKGVCHAGNLIVEEYVRTGKDVRKARLLNTKTMLFVGDLIPPLFEVEIVTMNDQQMVLRGYNYLFGVSLFREHVINKVGYCRTLRPGWGIEASRLIASRPGSTCYSAYFGRGRDSARSGMDKRPALNSATASSTARATLRTSSCIASSLSSTSWLLA